MDPENTHDIGGEIEETSAAPPPEVTDSESVEGRPFLKGINRRTFLAAAALGSAAAAMVNNIGGIGSGLGGLSFGPLAAFADDLTSLNCQAGDVQIQGTGSQGLFQIINEPCNCLPGTSFQASVAAVIVNNASSSRFCVVAHLPATTVTVGTSTVIFTQSDFLVASSIAGKSTVTSTFGIGAFPCGLASVSFGQALPSTYVKGPCPNPTQSCGTISWLQPSDSGASCPTLGPINDALLPSPSPSKCRHQQIVIQGRAASFSATGNTTCGGTATLVVNAGGDGGTYSVTVTGSDGFNSHTVLTSTALSAAVTYTDAVTTTTTYTACVGFAETPTCTQCFTQTVTATPLGTPTITASSPDCSGVVSYTATLSGATSFTFTDDITATTAGASPGTATRTYTPTTLVQTHTMTVVASNAGNCTNTAATTVTVPASVTVSLSAAGGSTCAALASSTVTLTATAGGGVAPYTLTWSVDTTPTQTSTVTTSGGAATYTYAPNLDAAAHTVLVSIADSRLCSGTSASKTISQCVNTSIT